MKTKLCAVVALLTIVVAPLAFAQEKSAAGKAGKKKGQAAQTPAAQLLKQLEPAGLTVEQTAKIKEMGKKADDTIKMIQTEAKLTPELLKARRDATASMKDSDKKGKARGKAIDAAAGLTEAQSAAFAKANAVRTKLKTEALKLLSDDQKAKLPAQFTATAKGDQAAGGDAPASTGKKGKKKANNSAE